MGLPRWIESASCFWFANVCPQLVTFLSLLTYCVSTRSLELETQLSQMSMSIQSHEQGPNIDDSIYYRENPAHTSAVYSSGRAHVQVTSMHIAARAQPELRVLPESTAEYKQYLDDFICQHLPTFYTSQSEKAKIWKLAAEAAKLVCSNSSVPEDIVPDLTKLALYDFVFLCGTYVI
jgi:hypothetical protein